MKRILLIEDNADLAFGLRASLEVEGYEALHAGDGVAGLARGKDSAPDLVVLDLMLPGLGGYEVLRGLRAAGIMVPVLVLSAKGEEVDKVQGFRLGADDYAVKPIGLLEFLARVAALLRRGGPGEGGVVLRAGDLELDGGRRVVTVAGTAVALSPLEFDLLHALARRQGGLVTRKELLREVWGYRADVESRTVDTHIAKLRAKVDGADRERIVTVRKKGYRLQ